VPDDETFLRRAIELSRIHQAAGGGPFGAVVVRDGAIVGEGWNRVTATLDPTAHAEVVAIRAAAQRLQTFTLAGSVIYSSCEPCPMCLGAIHWARIEGLCFGNGREDAASIGFDDALLYREVGLALEDRRIPTRQMLREEAYVAFAEWDAREDKVPY
jgi:guanine deaminase